MARTLLVVIGLVVLRCTSQPPSEVASQKVSEPGCERALFAWNLGQLDLRSVSACDRVEPIHDDRAWRLERLDSNGEVVDFWPVDPANVRRVPPGEDAPTVVVGEGGAFSVRWNRSPRVKAVRLLGQAWTLPVGMAAVRQKQALAKLGEGSESAETDWLALGAAEVSR
jgi:hypothetical protein